MATRWSSQEHVAEHRDLQVNAMAVDFHGQLALLAGRRTIAVVDLSNPSATLSKVPRQSKWQIDAVQWNPHASHAHLFITACNQRADLWTWDNGHSRQQGSLKAHTRVISDLDWSPFNPSTIATCSVDTYTHLWDIRDMRKPRQSLQGIAGVSQVKWNKCNSHLLATCHDGDIRVWDARKGNQPFQYIAGHLSKIHGLDWSPHCEDELATSSQDCTVKFWNINQPRQATDKMSPSNAPVWRARYTPFGRGLVTVVVPQLRRGENSLLLWNRDELSVPVHTFVGHSDVVLEFQWRSQGQAYQLVTWSKDQSLRLWSVEPILQKHCGADIEVNEDDGRLFSAIGSSDAAATSQLPEKTPNQNIPQLNGTAVQGSTAKVPAELAKTPPLSEVGIPKREEIHSPQQPKSLIQEFALVNFDVNNVKVTEMDAVRRKCVVTAMSSNGHHMVTLTMSFPDAYPNNASPNFELIENPRISKNQEAFIVKDLNTTAQQHVQYNRSCIEPCLLQLVASLDSLGEQDDVSTEEDKSDQAFLNNRPVLNTLLFQPTTYQSYKDKTVPFPRTSGARFGGSGLLVCFTRKTEPPRRTVSAAEVTPRALGDLSNFGPQVARTPQRTPPVYGLFSTLPSTTPPAGSSDMLQKWYEYKDTHTHGAKQAKRARSKSRSNHQRQDSFKLDQQNTSPRKRDKQSRVGPVIIYDVQCIMPVNKLLAEKYLLDTNNIERTCAANADLAAKVGRQDLVQLWSLLALTVPPSLDPCLDPDAEPWACHPFGRRLIKSLIDHYASLSDVQTLAMLTCAISRKYDPHATPPAPSHVSRATSDYTLKSAHSNYNTYHTIHSTDMKGWSHITASKTMRRSNSWSDMNFEGFLPAAQQEESEKDRHLRNVRLVDPYENRQYDQFKKAYADILYRMDLLVQRAQVLKYVSCPPEPHKGVEFKTNCHYCHEETRGVQCFHNNCKKFAFQCVICHVAVRGASSFCLACGHGGHTSHMMQWFSGHEVCPSGCGCRCLQENPMGGAAHDFSNGD